MIPEAAVEAAVGVLWDKEVSDDDVRAALEAGLPYLLPLGPHVTWGSEVTPANTAHIAHCPQCQEAFSR